MQKSTTTIYASFVSLRARHYMTTETAAPCPWIDIRYLKLQVVRLNLKNKDIRYSFALRKEIRWKGGWAQAVCIQEKLCVEQWLIGKVHWQTMAKSICTALRFRNTPNPNATVSSQVRIENVWGWTEETIVTSWLRTAVELHQIYMRIARSF